MDGASTLGYTDAAMEKQITRTAHNATAIAISTLLARGIQFVWVIVLARMISVADYGIWGTIGAMITTAATIPEFGMGLIVLRDVARHPEAAGRYLTATLVVQPLLAVVAYIGLVLIALLLQSDTPTRLLIALAATSLIIDTLGTMCYNQLLAAEQMVATSAITILHLTMLVGLGFAAVALGGGLIGLYWATILAGLMRVAMFWVITLRLHIRPVWPPDLAVMRSLFRDGFPLALNSFLNLAYQHINRVFVYVLLAPVETGYLTAAFVIVFGVVDLLNSTVLIALYPALSRLAHNQPQEAHKMADRLAFLTLAMTVPLGVGISQLSSRLASLLFPGFTGTATVLEVMIWYAVVMMVGNFYTQLMIIQNRQRVMLVIQVIGLALNIGLSLALLPIFRVQGAALALLISQLVVFTLFVIDHHPDRATLSSLVQRTFGVGVAALAMALTIFALREANLFVAGALGTVAYAIVALLLRVLLPEDWALLRTVASALPLIGPAIGRRLQAAAVR